MFRGGLAGRSLRPINLSKFERMDWSRPDSGYCAKDSVDIVSRSQLLMGHCCCNRAVYI